MTRDEARAIMRRLEEQVLTAPGVTGCMLRESNEPPGFRIVITVSGPAAEATDQLPSEAEGVPVEIVSRGPYRRHDGE